MSNKEQNDQTDRDVHIARLASQWPEPERSELSRFLHTNAGMTVRDWKGKGPSCPVDAMPGEASWLKLRAQAVREAAASASARDLPHNVRQAAARDPALIWNPLARKYRLRLPSDPLPGVKSSEPDHLGTGAGLEFESKHGFPVGNTPAPARVSPRRRARGG